MLLPHFESLPIQFSLAAGGIHRERVAEGSSMGDEKRWGGLGSRGRFPTVVDVERRDRARLFFTVNFRA